MAGLRGYPQPGYKAAARDFQSAPPLSPKRAPPVSGGDPVDAQLLQEIISGTAYSRKEELLLEIIEVAAEKLERVESANIAVKALKVPGRFLPVLNAFLLGYDAANYAIDLYEWYYRTEAGTPAQLPSTAGLTNECFGSGGTTGNYTKFIVGPNGGPVACLAFEEWHASSIGSIDQSNVSWGSTHSGWRLDAWRASTPADAPAFGTWSLAQQAWGGGAAIDYFDPMQWPQVPNEVLVTSALPIEPPAPKIPYKLIPYVNPDPTPRPAPEPSGWFITNGPTPPDTTGFRDTPGREKKKQLTGAGAAAMRIAKALINAATESCDAIEAMWDAIPERLRINYGYQYEKIKYKRVGDPLSGLPEVSVSAKGPKGSSVEKNFGVKLLWEPAKAPKKKLPLAKDALGRKIVESKKLSRISCTRMAKAFALNPRLVDDIDWTKAINNLIVNQIEDAVIGFPNKIANDAFVKRTGYNRPVGLGTGPAF